jgi:hypothetical protein
VSYPFGRLVSISISTRAHPSFGSRQHVQALLPRTAFHYYPVVHVDGQDDIRQVADER